MDNSFDASLDEGDDAEERHLQMLTQQLVQPSPATPRQPSPTPPRPPSPQTPHQQSPTSHQPSPAPHQPSPAPHQPPMTPMTPMTPITPSSTDPGIAPQLQNIVSTVNLGCKLDLKKIALQARNAEYNPKRFAAVIMRIREPRTTALIFSSGKMVCTGAKSEEQSRLAARKYARIVQKLGFDVSLKCLHRYHIVNIGLTISS